MPELDPLVHALYQDNHAEADRLFSTALGEWERIRVWDLLERLLPPPPDVRVLDVGGGPGVHAGHLAGLGYDVTLVDPVPRHVEQATERALAGGDGGAFTCELGDARALRAADGSYDVVLLMGPLYHLEQRADRDRALAEARRVLKPGGLLVAQSINATAWVLDATLQGRLTDDGIFDDFATNLTTGLSAPREKVEAKGGGFWAFFHRPDQLRAEVTDAGFTHVTLFGLEGYAWMLGNLETLLAEQRNELLRATRLIETDPHLLGASEHLVVAGRRP